MNLIINLIIKIFEALFEEDRKRRAPRTPAPVARGPGQREPAPPSEPGQQPRRTIEDWLEELFRDETAPPPPTRTERPPPVPAYRKSAEQQHQETLAEHLRKNEERIRRQKQHIRDLERRIENRMGGADEHYKTKTPRHRDRLPGDRPLEQMIYAQVILGPCKAQQHSSRLL